MNGSHDFYIIVKINLNIYLVNDITRYHIDNIGILVYTKVKTKMDSFFSLYRFYIVLSTIQ